MLIGSPEKGQRRSSGSARFSSSHTKLGISSVLHVATSGKYECFYAPFDWVNDEADVVIVGITPGLQQASEALVSFRRAIAAGKTLEDAARIAKGAASFKGTMRSLGTRLMDHFRLHTIFGLSSSLELFGVSARRAHYTSVVRYPIIKDGKNYSGDKRLMERPMLRSIVDANLPGELKSLPSAWIVPFGPTANQVIDQMVQRGKVDATRVLGGILHPGGQQWNRYNVQFGLVDEAEAKKVPGGLEVLRKSAELHEKVASILARRKGLPDVTAD